jgi:uncharacterized cupredoxin-like copper-binding protein
VAATAVVALGLGLGACSGDERERPSLEELAKTVTPDDSFVVLAWEWQFQPSVIGLAPGERVQITFENTGEIIHNMRIFDLDTEVIESGEDGELFVEAEPGEEAMLEFVAPAGEHVYEFYCTVPDHRDLGMEGTIVVLDPI